MPNLGAARYTTHFGKNEGKFALSPPRSGGSWADRFEGMRMSFRTIAMTTLAASALTACASGSGDDSAPIRALLSADALMFVAFDADSDLSITNAESEAGIAREFARADANSDGSLQPIEFANWSNQVLGGSQIGPYRLDFDRNVDNVITREEFDNELRARFTTYDSDENGALARGEFVRLVGQARQRRPARQIAPPIGSAGPGG
jgi:hypothetical protein